MEPEVSLSYSRMSVAGIFREPHGPNQNLSIVDGTFCNFSFINAQGSQLYVLFSFPAKLLYVFPICSFPSSLPCRPPLLPYWISTFCVLVVTVGQSCHFPAWPPPAASAGVIRESYRAGKWWGISRNVAASRPAVLTDVYNFMKSELSQPCNLCSW
jgi:hypothetical protein